RSVAKCVSLFALCAGGGVEKAARVDRALPLAQLKMELRLVDAAGRPDFRDCLPFVDRVALADEYLVAMRVSRDPAIRVLDQHEIAVAAQFVADISDDAALDGFDRGAARGRDVDPVIVRPVSRDAVARQHMAVHRPGEPAAGALDGRRRCGGLGARLLGGTGFARRERDRLVWPG